MPKLLKLLPRKVPWKVLAGFLAGALAGMIILLLGLALLAPTPNLPPPHRDDTPGDLTIRLSQTFLTALAAQNVHSVSLGIGSVPLEHVRAQPEPGDQLFILGDVSPPLLGTHQIMVQMQPCVANGRLAFVVQHVDAGGLAVTTVTRQMVQDEVNASANSVKIPVSNAHLARVDTTSTAMILTYNTSGTGGTPSCQTG